MRQNDRRADQLRPLSIEKGIQPRAAGSILIRQGGTEVVCAVSVEERVPPFLEGRGKGWITAEYGMLPGATLGRYRREAQGQSARSLEIQRLIGRSLRMMVDLAAIGARTLRVDCDVLNADGGTRTAAITGAALAVRDTLERLSADGRLAALPPILPVVAVSVGIVASQVLLDLDYAEDQVAEVDGNFVIAGDGRWIEVQASAEGRPCDHAAFLAMADLAQRGAAELHRFWR
jgi:ribonuclease PH